MGGFDLKASCSFCGKNLDFYTFRSRVDLQDGWICNECMKKIGLNKMKVSQIQKFKVADLQKSFDDLEEAKKTDQAPLFEYGVNYLGGYEGKPHEVIGVQLQMFKTHMHLRDINKHGKELDFGIPYSDIIDIRLYKNPVTTISHMFFVFQIHIDYEKNGISYTIRLQMPGTANQIQRRNLEFMDKIKTNGIEAQFRKKDEKKGTHVSAADEIRKFKELLDMGAITQEEYDTKKQELLNM